MTGSIAEVVPVSRFPRALGIFDYAIPPELDARLRPGHLVRVPFRTQELVGVLLERKSRPGVARDRLREVRGLTNPEIALTAGQLTLAAQIAERTLTSLGTVLKWFVPTLPKRFRAIPSPSPSGRTSTRPRELIPDLWSSPRPALIVPTTIEERDELLKAILTDDARGDKAVLVLAPETQEVRYLSRLLEDVHPLVLTGEDAATHRLLTWLGVRDGSTRTILGTKVSLFLPYPRLDAIVIVDEENPNHKQRDQNPRFDARWVARVLAERFRAKLISLSFAPTVETWHEAKASGWFLHRSPRRQGLVTILDLREERRAGRASILPEAIREAVAAGLSRGERSFLLLNRRGFARSVSCGDCGHIATCPRCGLPLVGHGDERTSRLACHRCRTVSELPPFCPYCNGIRFRFHGLGTERLEGELKCLFPNTAVSRLERGLSASPLGRIIVGTSFALTRLPWAEVGLTVVWPDANLLDDFRAEERTFQVLRAILGRLSKTARLIIATSSPENRAYVHLRDDRLEAFLDSELEERRAFRFPPFADLISLIVERKDRKAADRAQRNLARSLGRTVPSSLKAEIHTFSPRPRRRGTAAAGILLKLPPGSTDQSIATLLRRLPNEWTVDRDPVELT